MLFPASTLWILFCGALTLVASPLLSYPWLCVLCVLAQLAILVLVWREVRRLLSLVSLVALSWFFYYTVRMVTIMVATTDTYDHPAVANADEQLRAEIWIGSTCALAVFAAGMLWGRAVSRPRTFGPLTHSAEPVLRWIGFVGVLGTAAFNTVGIESGILGNILQSYLFAIAGLMFISARRRRYLPADIVLVFLAVALGILLNFKEPAVSALLAALIGYLAAGRRIRIRVLVVGCLVGVVMFSGIQAQRIARVQDPSSAAQGPEQFVSSFTDGFTRYNLAYGTAEEQSGISLLTNPFLGVLNRVKASDALFALRARVPDEIPFQEGKTLVEPTLSALPVPLPFALDFNQLSLGRYFSLNFWSLNPDSDQSSQALTVVGDLYLNWGWTGVIVVMPLFGFATGLIDRRYLTSSLVGAGTLAYALVPLLTLDRNIAYQVVTVGIRLVAALAIARLITTAVTVTDRSSLDGGAAKSSGLRSIGLDP